MWAQTWPELELPWKLVSPLINSENDQGCQQGRVWSGGRVKFRKSPQQQGLLVYFPENVPLYPEQGGGPAGRRQGKSFNLQPVQLSMSQFDLHFFNNCKLNEKIAKPQNTAGTHGQLLAEAPGSCED